MITNQEAVRTGICKPLTWCLDVSRPQAAPRKQRAKLCRAQEESAKQADQSGAGTRSLCFSCPLCTCLPLGCPGGCLPWLPCPAVSTGGAQRLGKKEASCYFSPGCQVTMCWWHLSRQDPCCSRSQCGQVCPLALGN